MLLDQSSNQSVDLCIPLVRIICGVLRTIRGALVTGCRDLEYWRLDGLYIKLANIRPIQYSNTGIET